MTAFFDLSVVASEKHGSNFSLEGGYDVTTDEGKVGGVYNGGHSTTLVWRGRKFRVSHLDLLRALIQKLAPEDLDDFNESLMDGGATHAGT